MNRFLDDSIKATSTTPICDRNEDKKQTSATKNFQIQCTQILSDVKTVISLSEQRMEKKEQHDKSILELNLRKEKREIEKSDLDRAQKISKVECRGQIRKKRIP